MSRLASRREMNGAIAYGMQDAGAWWGGVEAPGLGMGVPFAEAGGGEAGFQVE